MKKSLFGRLPSGEEVSLYTLSNGKLEARVLDYGCRIQSLLFEGQDFICGFDDILPYTTDDSYQGAFVGRFGNRIKNGKFTLNGKEYQLAKNDNGKHYLHGCFSFIMWEVKEVTDDKIVFFHHSPKEEEGYPADIDVTVTYRLENEYIVMEYEAMANGDTPANFTNHAYYNMQGFGIGTVLNQEMKLFADEITVVDDELIPVGRRMDVTGTPYDFRKYQPIGARFNDEVQGYDTNFVLNGTAPVKVCDYSLQQAASFRSDRYQLDCYTDMPCIQFYSGNFLGKGHAFKNNVPQRKQMALCLETQFEPDAVNHGGGILKGGEKYHHTTIYKFSRR